MNALIQSKKTIILRLLIPFVLVCFALPPRAQALDPAPDGGYPNGNTAEGDDALFSLDTSLGANNTAVGFQALYSNVGGPPPDGSNNTATGSAALFSNTTGGDNTATGSAALKSNTIGGINTATGAFALESNTIGNSNTATGVSALSSNTEGNENTATGLSALFSNTTGFENTATGVAALNSNTTGNDNTATGVDALLNNTTGAVNTANGEGVLYQNETGNYNTGMGVEALFLNNNGSYNTAIGSHALGQNTSGGSNIAIGSDALGLNTTGSSNIALGYQAGQNLTTGSNNIDIGNTGFPFDSGTIRIGTKRIHVATFITGIRGATVPNGVSVIVDNNGHLGTTTSSARFKDDVQPMDKASEAILALKPVTFRYKKELDPEGIPQFGLVAEEVEKVNPDLVARDDQGRPYTVRYEAVNAMLLNEFLKAHKAFVAEQRKVQEQGATIARLEQQIEALTAGLQKVSVQLELSKSGPQTVLNDQ
jgi:hypothetical protein